MKYIAFVLALLAACFACQAQSVAAPQMSEKKPSLVAWSASIAALAAASAFDYKTSMDLRNNPRVHETNLLFTNANGRFSLGKGLAVKAGIVLAFAVPEYFLLGTTRAGRNISQS